MKRLLTIFLLGAVLFPVGVYAQEKEQETAPTLSEHIDAFFSYGVSALDIVLFFDPFKIVGIHDGLVSDDQGRIVFDIAKFHSKEHGSEAFNYTIEGSQYRKEQLLVFSSTGQVIEAESGQEVLDAEGNRVADSEMKYALPNKIPFVVIWLVLGAIFFTFKMRFVNLWGFKHALELVAGKFDDPKDKGEVSHFQALATALSGTVGLGNIAGVAVAVGVGGPGATFWMITAGLLGMTSKFVECTLGVKYRKINEEGTVFGGPMYYLSQGLANRGFAGFGTVLSVLFAILCIAGSFGGGNMFQANQAYQQVQSQIPFLANDYMDFVFAFLLAAVVGVVIIGGIKSIAKVTDKIVPLMAAIYVGSALIILVMNYDKIGWAFGQILSGAFAPTAVYGGFIGVLIQGFRRAAFSNEAGVGSASIAHSAAKTNEPVSEGIVALLEPFIDTVVICTCTALVIIISGQYTTMGLEGTEMTSQAFSQSISWFPMILTISVLLFAFSTMVSWSYYGLNAWAYLFGRNQRTLLAYKVLFLLMIVVGTTAPLGAVIDFSDMMILCMAVPNILGLVIMSSEVRKDMVDYFKRIASGEIKKFK